MNVEKVKNEIELAINTMGERQTPQSKNSFRIVNLFKHSRDRVSKSQIS